MQYAHHRSEMIRKINKTLRALRKLKDGPGKQELEFLAEFEGADGADVLRNAQLHDGLEDRKQVEEDRAHVEITDSMAAHLTDRFHNLL